MEEQLVRTEERVGGRPELAAELGKKKKTEMGESCKKGWEQPSSIALARETRQRTVLVLPPSTSATLVPHAGGVDSGSCPHSAHTGGNPSAVLNPETISKPSAWVRSARTDGVGDGGVCGATCKGALGVPAPAWGSCRSRGQEDWAGGGQPHTQPPLTAARAQPSPNNGAITSLPLPLF